jgi:hypothetical protein
MRRLWDHPHADAGLHVLLDVALAARVLAQAALGVLGGDRLAR